jgi:hypothetical protein
MHASTRWDRERRASPVLCSRQRALSTLVPLPGVPGEAATRARQRVRRRPANDNDNQRVHRQAPRPPQNTAHTRTVQVTTGPRQCQHTQRGRRSAGGMQNRRKRHTHKG